MRLVVTGLVFVVLFGHLCAKADQDGPYTFTVTDGEATITDFDEAYVGALSITNNLGGYPVTTIGDSAFEDCESLSSVTIPDSVTIIGDEAFVMCTSLADVTIPDNVTTIEAGAFAGCTSLTDVTIGRSVTNIGDYAFHACFSLTAITVDLANPSFESVDGVLFNKSQTTLIQWPGGRTDSYAIPAGVTNIGVAAFAYSANLTSVTIPDSVTAIGRGAFSMCIVMSNITVNGANLSYSSVDGVLFDKAQTRLIQCPGGRTGGYAVPASVTSIGNEAFARCTNLTVVAIPAGVTNIGSGAFYFCTGFTAVTIPDSVITIEDSAFSFCTNLASVTIGNGVTTIGEWAFAYSANLQRVYFAGSPPETFGSSVFDDADNVIVYYLPGDIAWSSFQDFADRPVVLWNPEFTTVGLSAGTLSCTITGTTNIPILVETCTDLVAAAWSPLQTTNLTTGSFDFTDPNSTNYPARFYRITGP